MDLEFWLKHIRTLHPRIIDYSLERIKAVAARLDLLRPKAPIIMVTGTNGKGSTVAAMEAILLASKRRVGSFTSPYLISFNEQIRIDGDMISDETLINAFKSIDVARGDLSLSEFEFTTLAALIAFKNENLDVILFEVGLGGGNDATNIIDPEVTIITSLALDHEEYLGATLEAIARNEAALLRAHKPGIIGVKEVPHTLTEYAAEIDCPLSYLERDFHFEEKEHSWRFWNTTHRFDDLPLPAILCKNAALAIQALLAFGFEFSQAQLCCALENIYIQGRLQFIHGQPSYLFDVAHNLEAIEHLRSSLVLKKPQGKVIAVFSMFSDKKISDALKLMAPYVDFWFIAAIDHPRGATLAQLKDAFKAAGIHEQQILISTDLKSACQQARASANPDDLILVFGSFFVVRAGFISFQCENMYKCVK